MQGIARRYKKRAAARRGRTVTRSVRRRTAPRASRLFEELKFLDCAWNGVTINTSTDGAGGELVPSSGSTNNLSTPAQGDGQSNRDGRKFVIKSVWLSGTVATEPQEDQANANEAFGTFFALVLDTQTNGGVATGINSEDVFDNPSTSATAMLPQPLRNLENSKRFRILASQYVEPGGMYAMADGTNTGSLNMQNAPCVNLSWRGNITVTCTGTTADVASVSDNSIHLVAYRGGAPQSTFQGKSRVRFIG